MQASSTTRLQAQLCSPLMNHDRRDASWSGVSAAVEEAPLRFSARGRPLYNVARLPSGASSPLRAGGYDSDYWAYDDGYGSPSGRSRGTGRGQGHDPTYHGTVGGSPRAGGKERALRPPREPGPPQPKKSHTGKGKEGLPHRKGAAQMAEAAAQAAAEAALRDAASAALAEDEAKALAEKAAREAIAAVAADFRRGGKFFRTMPALGKRKSEKDRLASDAEDADSAGDGSDGSKGSKSKKQKVGAAAAGSKGAADGQTANKRGRAPSQKLVDAAAASPSSAPVRVRVRVRNANVIKRQPGMSLAEAAAAAAAENLPAVSVSNGGKGAGVPAARQPKTAKVGKAKAGNMAAPAPGRRGRSAAAAVMDGPAVPEAQALPSPVKKRKAVVLSSDNVRSSDALQQLPIKKRKAAAAAASAVQANAATNAPAGKQRSSQAKPGAVLPKASKPAKAGKQAAKAGPRGKPPAAQGKSLVQSASNGAAPDVSKGATNASVSGRARQMKAAKKSSKTAPAGPLRRGRSGVQ